VAKSVTIEYTPSACGPSNPMGENFDYAAEFQSLDLDAVKKTSML
jgi:catalase (peroxidase I)